jgi:MSHA pilin protein MshC
MTELRQDPLRGRAGFTMTELVVTIVIAGILAAIALPRFVARDAFDSRGFHDEATGVVRFAQKTAIAWRRTVYVCVTPGSVSASGTTGDAACATPLAHPAKGGPLVASAPNGVSLPAASFSFDALGRPSPNAQVTITFTSTVPGDPARQIVVEAETGYVHP